MGDSGSVETVRTGIRWTTVTVVALLVAGTALSGAVAAHEHEKRYRDNPFHEDYHEHCPPGSQFGDDTRCLVATSLWRTYACGIYVYQNGPDTAVHILNSVIENLYPNIKGAKCEATNDTQSTIDWWNEDVEPWQDSWRCWILGGPDCPEPKRSVYLWTICKVRPFCDPGEPPTMPDPTPPPHPIFE